MGIPGYLEILRPANSIMVGFAVIVGSLIAQPFLSFDYSVLLSGFLTGFLISSFAMVINDYYEAENDVTARNHTNSSQGNSTAKPP